MPATPAATHGCTCPASVSGTSPVEQEILLGVLVTASSMHRQHKPGCRTFKATLSHPNHGAHLLLQLLLQKDAACCASLYSQHGQNEKPEISLPNHSKAEKESHCHLTIWEQEGWRAELSPPIPLLSWGCRGRVFCDILTYCPINAKFSSD